MKKKLFVSSLALSIAFSTFAFTANAHTAVEAGAIYDSVKNIFYSVFAKNGMVSSEQELATQVGADILKQGGNAVDAAVAVGYALAVALPNAGNIGGGGFMVIYDGKAKKSVAVDFRETAPSKATRDMFLDKDGNVIEGMSVFSHAAVGVPGSVAGFNLALEKWGTMPLEKVIAPAIKLAEEGFPVSDYLADHLESNKDSLSKWDATKAIFFKNGEPLKSGDLLVQKDLAESLKLIAKEGTKAFYEGEIAQKIVAEMEKHGGLISAEDLKNYKAVERTPLEGMYRGFKVVTMPPPSSGGVHIIQILNMLEKYPLGEFGANSAKSIHVLVEAAKLAYADRAEYLGDPDFVKVPVKGLTSPKYAAEQVKQVNLEKARPASEIKAGVPQPYESDQTTHYSVMDKSGNAVAVTYTLNMNFGSGIVAEGTGILLNDQMDDFSVKPGVANAFGLIGSDANAIEANKRPLSSMSPTIVLKDDRAWFITGANGGSRIITTVLQSIINMIDHKMTPAEAVSTVRVHHQWTPDELRIEKGLNIDTIELLKAKGHKNINVKAPMGRVQIVESLPNGQGFYGAADPRSPDGKAIGF